ncbi:hypothetical protein GPUN_2622 [Glaciecola punicea ACAM 611]|uniref:Uncharacterized protein n=1 Tax=Glaciecola punicea ACAM 611 TaxID=1121923 RepID=H5TEL0_9ALTE|nr:hypothetical protein GPUN_2622 [Glaciecola punicea ACAM 611]
MNNANDSGNANIVVWRRVFLNRRISASLLNTVILMLVKYRVSG